MRRLGILCVAALEASAASPGDLIVDIQVVHTERAGVHVVAGAWIDAEPAVVARVIRDIAAYGSASETLHVEHVEQHARHERSALLSYELLFVPLRSRFVFHDEPSLVRFRQTEGLLKAAAGVLWVTQENKRTRLHLILDVDAGPLIPGEALEEAIHVAIPAEVARIRRSARSHASSGQSPP